MQESITKPRLWGAGLRRAVAWGAGWRPPGDRLGWALLLLGPALGVASAYLVVAGWRMAVLALALGLAMPALLVLHRRPFAAVLIWLLATQFLLRIEVLIPYRVAFWMLHRALPPLTLGLLVLGAALRISPRPLPRLGAPELLMAGYVAASLASIIALSDEPLATAYRLYDRVFAPICLYLIVRLSAPGERELGRLALAALAVCAAQVVIGALSWAMPSLLPPAWLGQAGARTTGSLINASTYSSTLVFCGLLLLHVAVSRGRGAGRALYLGLFVAAGLFTFLSFSRASWLGGLLALGGAALLYPRPMLRIGAVVAPLLALALGTGALEGQLSWARERLYSEEAAGSALDRLPTYLAALRMFEERPLLGWGYDKFDDYDRRFQGRVLDLASDNKDHANHNAYLTILAEQGALGLLLYLGPPLLLLARSARAWRGLPAEGLWSRRLLALLWLSQLNIFVVNSFTPAWVPYALGLWWLNLGLIAHVASGPRPAAPMRSRL